MVPNACSKSGNPQAKAGAWSIKKTKVIWVSKTIPEPAFVNTSSNETIERVSSLNYLCATFTADGRNMKEIRRRTGMAKAAFNKMRAIFTDPKLSLNIKLRWLEPSFDQSCLNGAEAWTLNAEICPNIEAAEMWFYRRMLKISFLDYVTIEKVLHCTQAERQRNFWRSFKAAKLKFLRHKIRKRKLEDLRLGGKIKGKRARGGQRKIYRQNFMQFKSRENYGTHPETEMSVGSCIKPVRLTSVHTGRKNATVQDCCLANINPQTSLFDFKFFIYCACSFNVRVIILLVYLTYNFCEQLSFNSIVYSPGHAHPLQFLLSITVSLVGHGGFIHFLVRLWNPEPHDLEHGSQSVHWLK